MKKFAVCMAMLLLLTGCSGNSSEIDTGLELRTKLQQSDGYTFDTHIQADYGDKLQAFSLHCEADSQGSVSFTVTAPETISGITGTLDSDGGRLTFDEAALHFDLLAEDQLSPVSAPWILDRTLRSGYLTSACQEDGSIHLTLDDSYEANALQLDVWLNQENLPEKADILYAGRRILTLRVENFAFL